LDSPKSENGGAERTLDDLLSLFATNYDLTWHELVPESLVPEPYHRLLCHPHHMTVALEAFLQTTVAVTVWNRRQTGSEYARKIVLTPVGESRVVLFGIVTIDLTLVPPEVARNIVAEQTPLGRVLLEAGVLTTVEPVEYVKVSLGPDLAQAMQVEYGTTTFGRTGRITANGHPAIRVLEILAPLPPVV
jgi:chorismate-pyruvate lyase